MGGSALPQGYWSIWCDICLVRVCAVFFVWMLDTLIKLYSGCIAHRHQNGIVTVPSLIILLVI